MKDESVFRSTELTWKVSVHEKIITNWLKHRDRVGKIVSLPALHCSIETMVESHVTKWQTLPSYGKGFTFCSILKWSLGCFRGFTFMLIPHVWRMGLKAHAAPFYPPGISAAHVWGSCTQCTVHIQLMLRDFLWEIDCMAWAYVCWIQAPVPF